MQQFEVNAKRSECVITDGCLQTLTSRKITGERYASARRNVVTSHPAPIDAAAQSHLPGSVPIPTALRVLLTEAGVTARDGTPLSEALTYGLCGGIGAGVFAFHYAKEDFSSFYVAGSHLWQDFLTGVTATAKRLGLAPVVKEFGGAGPAEKGLAAMLADGPVIAWVDMGHLPHRGMPATTSGAGYHVVTVYRAEPGGEALIGDLADAPIALPTSALTSARGRIKKDKFRIVSLPRAGGTPDLNAALLNGLATGAAALTQGRMKNFTVAAFGSWANQLHGSKAKDSWEKMFPRGQHLWAGLTSTHNYIEYYGTGGGLTRPLYSETLTEAAGLLDRPGLRQLAKDYAALGAAWTTLAETALPSRVPQFAQAARLMARREELLQSGPEGREDAASTWEQLAALGTEVARNFPLTEATRVLTIWFPSVSYLTQHSALSRRNVHELSLTFTKRSTCDGSRRSVPRSAG
jgi:hypothetical protein